MKIIKSINPNLKILEAVRNIRSEAQILDDDLDQIKIHIPSRLFNSVFKGFNKEDSPDKYDTFLIYGVEIIRSKA